MSPLTISQETLCSSLDLILNPTKHRRFLESVDLQLSLRDYDPYKDRRFSGTLVLPHSCRPRLKVCMIADAKHA